MRLDGSKPYSTQSRFQVRKFMMKQLVQYNKTFISKKGQLENVPLFCWLTTKYLPPFNTIS